MKDFVDNMGLKEPIRKIKLCYEVLRLLIMTFLSADFLFSDICSTTRWGRFHMVFSICWRIYSECKILIKFIRKLLVFKQSYIFWVDNIWGKFKFLQKELKTWILKKIFCQWITPAISYWYILKSKFSSKRSVKF